MSGAEWLKPYKISQNQIILYGEWLIYLGNFIDDFSGFPAGTFRVISGPSGFLFSTSMSCHLSFCRCSRFSGARGGLVAKGMGLSCQHLTQIAQEACAPASRAEGAGLLLRPVDPGCGTGAVWQGGRATKAFRCMALCLARHPPRMAGFFHGACSGLFRGPPPHPLRASAGAGFCGT